MFDKNKDSSVYEDENIEMNEYYKNLFNVVSDDFNLYESKIWNAPNIIEKGILYFRHGVEVEYSINIENKLILYEKNATGKYWNPTIYPCKLYYLENLNQEIRKRLTLEEVLKLNRRPTLQEIVDLSLEDYVKYLYHKGVIEYAPELMVNYLNFLEQDDAEYNDSYDIILDNLENYDPCVDIILALNNFNYKSVIDKDERELIYVEYEKYEGNKVSEHYIELWDVPVDFNLYESYIWNDLSVIEKGILYSRYGIEIEYSIHNENKLIIYEKNTDGKYWYPTAYIHKLYYLENLNR